MTLDDQPATLRSREDSEATDFIDANAHRHLTLTDIAAAVGADARALRHAFRHHYGVTPQARLREVRLDGAHRDLRAGDPARGDTVASIAARWGHRRVDGCTAAYVAAYGVPPSHTLGS